MQRNMELIRRIGLAVEAASEPVSSRELAVDGHAAEQVGYHAALMHEAGLIAAEPLAQWDGRFDELRIDRLTWRGHEFLDSARSEALWAQVMRQVCEKATAVAFDLLLDLLKAAARRAIGLTAD